MTEISNIERRTPNAEREGGSEELSERELAANLGSLTPAQFDRLLDIWQGKLFSDELSGKWKFDLLKEHRPQLFHKSETSNRQPPTANRQLGGDSSDNGAVVAERRGVAAPAVTVPARVGTMAALAGFLNEYFRGQLCKKVQKDHISQWSRNNREYLGWVLVDGVKAVPPALCCEIGDSGFYDPRAAAEWFGKWILPQARWRMKGETLDFTHEEKMQRFAERKAQREEEIAEGRFKSVEVFNQHCVAFGAAVNGALNEAEKQIKTRIVTEFKGLGVEGFKSLEIVEDAIGRVVREAVDGIRERVARALLEAKEPEGDLIV